MKNFKVTLKGYVIFAAIFNALFIAIALYCIVVDHCKPDFSRPVKHFKSDPNGEFQKTTAELDLFMDDYNQLIKFCSTRHCKHLFNPCDVSEDVNSCDVATRDQQKGIYL